MTALFILWGYWIQLKHSFSGDLHGKFTWIILQSHKLIVSQSLQ